MDNIDRKLLQLLKPLSGGEFTDEIVSDWYLARRYVLKHLCQWEKIRKKLKGEQLRFYIYADSQLSLALARQLSLAMHHIGFSEGTRSSRTLIVLLYREPKTISQLEEEVADTLAKEEFLCNLIKYCDYTLTAAGGKTVQHEGLPYLDLEFELRATDAIPDTSDGFLLPEGKAIRMEITGKEDGVCTEFSEADLQRAMRVNSAYSLGSTIDNLPSADNETPKRYNIALDYLRGVNLKKRKKSWEDNLKEEDDGEINQIKLRNVLSCIVSGDLFESHIRSVMDYYGKIDYKYMLKHAHEIRRALHKNLRKLAYLEHNRWNVEKLIMGFRPLNFEEALKDELELHDRDEKRKKMKNDKHEPVHIDIASYADLKRINPKDIKYDYFIILAIPHILRRSYHDPWYIRLKAKFTRKKKEDSTDASSAPTQA